MLNKADEVVTVSPSWVEDFKEMSNREDIKLITNGYDHFDFIEPDIKLDKNFSIAHIGSMNADRNPETLWKVLSELCKNDATFKNDLSINLIGQVDYAISSSLQKLNLNENCEKIDFIPHKKVVKKMMQSQVLLLPINKTSNSMGILPGKLYEYMGAKRPILCIGSKEADSFTIINNANAGFCVDYNNYENTKKAVLTMYCDFKKNNLKVESTGIEQYSRKNLAAKYADLIAQLIEKN